MRLLVLAWLAACTTSAPPPVQKPIGNSDPVPSGPPPPKPVAKSGACKMPPPSSSASMTSGTLDGGLCTPKGEPLIGATVVATSDSLVGEQVAITDEDGRFRIGSLPPGKYTITIYYNDRTFEKAASIEVGRVTWFSHALDVNE